MSICITIIMIYFIKSESKNANENIIKIGLTFNDIKSRKSNLQVGQHNELEILESIKCIQSKKLETLLHKIYKKNNMRGEWFKFTDNELKDAVNNAKKIALEFNEGDNDSDGEYESDNNEENMCNDQCYECCEDGNNLICKSCDYKTDRESNMKRHVISKLHTKRCELIGGNVNEKIDGKDNRLDDRKDDVMNTFKCVERDGKNYVCPHCNYVTQKFNNISRHLTSKLHAKNCELLCNHNNNGVKNNNIVKKDNNMDIKNENIVTNNNNLSQIISIVVNVIKSILPDIVSGVMDKQKLENNNDVNNNDDEPINKSRKFDFYVCKYCGKKYENSKSKYKHQRKCGEKLNGLDNESSDEDNDNIRKELKELKRQLKIKEEQIELLKRNCSVILDENKQVSTLQYAKTHFNDAPVLKKLEKGNVKEILNFEKTLNNKDYVIEFCEELLKQYKHRNFVPFLGKIIGKYFSDDIIPKKRKIWTTDYTRCSLIIMRYIESPDKVNRQKDWISDKAGILFIELVLDPILDFMGELLSKYNSIQESKDENFGKKLGTIPRALLKEISLESFKNDILKAICPYLTINMEKTGNVKEEKPKKVTKNEKPKIIVKKTPKK